VGVVGTPGDKAVNRRGFMRTLAAFSLAPAAKMKAAEIGFYYARYEMFQPSDNPPAFMPEVGWQWLNIRDAEASWRE